MSDCDFGGEMVCRRYILYSLILDHQTVYVSCVKRRMRYLRSLGMDSMMCSCIVVRSVKTGLFCSSKL